MRTHPCTHARNMHVSTACSPCPRMLTGPLSGVAETSLLLFWELGNCLGGGVYAAFKFSVLLACISNRTSLGCRRSSRTCSGNPGAAQCPHPVPRPSAVLAGASSQVHPARRAEATGKARQRGGPCAGAGRVALGEGQPVGWGSVLQTCFLLQAWCSLPDGKQRGRDLCWQGSVWDGRQASPGEEGQPVT